MFEPFIFGQWMATKLRHILSAKFKYATPSIGQNITAASADYGKVRGAFINTVFQEEQTILESAPPFHENFLYILMTTDGGKIKWGVSIITILESL